MRELTNSQAHNRSLVHSIAVRESMKNSDLDPSRSIMGATRSTRSRRAQSNAASIDGAWDSVLDGRSQMSSVMDTHTSVMDARKKTRNMTSHATQQARRGSAHTRGSDYPNRKLYLKLTKTKTVNPGSIMPQPVIDLSGQSMLEPRYGNQDTHSEIEPVQTAPVARP